MKQNDDQFRLPRGMRFDSLWDRRRFLATMGAGGLFFTQRGAFAQALVLTPAQTEGPYYPNQLPLDRDNDLLVINDSITPAVGAVSWIGGRVLDRNGNPLRHALVEIWLADNVGSYIHTQGALNGRRDSNFQGYGRFLTASSGEYLFRAIKPGLYTGRSRHAHFKITLPGGTSLTTQLYVEGETGNDSVLNGIANAAQRASVVRPWTAIPNSSIGELATTFDIVMNFTPSDTGTPSRPTLVSMAGVVNGATLQEGAPSGSWVTLFGDGLSTTTRSWRDSDFVNNRLPESLDGVSVQINGQPAAVNYISPKQLNVLAPDAIADGNVQVTVTNSNGASSAVTASLRRYMPGFFQFPQEYAAAVRNNGAVVAPAGLIDGVVSTPARPGETILLYGTGFGPTIPAAAANQILSTAAPTATAVKIQIHNRQAEVAFAGLTGAGLYQFNVTVPDLEDGDYPVTAEVGGVRTAKIARIRIQRQTSTAIPMAPAKIESGHKAYLALIRRIRKNMV